MRVAVEKAIYKQGKAVYEAAEREHGMSFLLAERGDGDTMSAYQREQGVRCFIIGVKRYSDGFYRSLQPGSLIARFGVGLDSVPLDLCRELGIKVAYAPGTSDQSVAEQTFALILAWARNIAGLNLKLKNGQWVRHTGVELCGRVIALIGFGNIAKRVAVLARSGFSMRVYAHDIRTDVSEDELALVDMYSNELEPVLRDADFISLHLPATHETEAFVDSAFLAQLKPTAVLVNTARGGLVDESALYDAIAGGGLAGAALDVFVREPYETLDDSKDLRKLEQVLMTPHTSAHTDSSNRRMAEACVANVLAYYEGRVDDLVLVPGSRA